MTPTHQAAAASEDPPFTSEARPAAQQETVTPAGRLRIAVLLSHDPGGLGDDAQRWLASVVRDDLPLLLELHSAYLRGDDMEARGVLDRLDGVEGDSGGC